MAKYTAFVFVVLLSLSACLADTFTNLQTGETFNGYLTNTKKANKTQVRIEKKTPRFININSYQIRRNYLGRKNKVFIFRIKDSINLISETEAFEQALTIAANQGPLFILIEIDAPAGRPDLVQRISNAIVNLENCTTVAFVTGEKIGGALSEAAVIALACDKIYIHKDAAIGAATAFPQPTAESEISEDDLFSHQRWLSYCSALAERNNRPALLTEAMLDENLEVAEIEEDDKRFFTDSTEPKEGQTLVRTWSEKGRLLKLTADEAVQTGVADKIVDSPEKLFADLAASEAAKAYDKRLLKARRSFERASREINRVLDAIEQLQQNADDIDQEIRRIETALVRSNQLFYDQSPETTLGNRPSISAPIDSDDLDNTLIYREQLLEQLLNVSQAIVRNCERAIPMAERHPDLQAHIEPLQQTRDTTTALIDRIIALPRIYY